MSFISVFNQKGGSGKTTTSLNLAVAAFLDGHRVAVLDMDDQASVSSSWFASRGDIAGPVVVKVPIHEIANAVAGAEADGFDFVVIDSPPGITPAAASIVAAADFVLIPVRPQKLDMDAIPRTVKLIGEKPFAFVLSDCPQRAPEIAIERNKLLKYQRPVLGPINNWRSIWRALETGQSVMEFEPQGPPALEFQTLYQMVVKELAK